MSQFTIMDNAFAVLSFLAAPAILTNASTVLALGTSNRLARAADRARLSSSAIAGAKDRNDPETQVHLQDFYLATERAKMLVKGLQCFYLSAGCFAGGTCIALVGAFADYFKVHFFDWVAQGTTIVAAALGVICLVRGSFLLARETQITLKVLDTQHALITQWRAAHPAPPNPPGV